jgi:putative ABC transport system ATP-binding protein
VRGRDTNELDDDELSTFRGGQIGFVFQSYNLLPQLDVLENIMVPVMYQEDIPEGIEDRARMLADRVGLGSRLDHRPLQLSGGQQQRVAIARSLINDPALILADEATGNLDSKTADEILNLFDELHAEGKTILLVTHEPDVGARAQRVLRLRDGRLESDSAGRAAPAGRAAAAAAAAGAGRAALAVGTAAGLLKGATGVSGPPVILYLLAGPEEARRHRANLILFFAIVSVISIIPPALGGLMGLAVLAKLVLLLPVLMLCVPVGARLFHVESPSAPAQEPPAREPD